MRGRQEAFDGDWGNHPMSLICMKAGDHVGWLRIYRINREKSEAWLTYFALDRRHWGRVLGTDALKTVLQTLLKEQEVNTLFLETFPDNHAMCESPFHLSLRCNGHPLPASHDGIRLI